MQGPITRNARQLGAHSQKIKIFKVRGLYSQKQGECMKYFRRKLICGCKEFGNIRDPSLENI
jgi:hypothetical protein